MSRVLQAGFTGLAAIVEHRNASASRRTHSLPRWISGHEIWSHRHPLLRGRGDCAGRE